MCVPTREAEELDASAIGAALNKLRQAKLTPEQRSESARKAIRARWDRYRAQKAAEAEAAKR